MWTVSWSWQAETRVSTIHSVNSGVIVSHGLKMTYFSPEGWNQLGNFSAFQGALYKRIRKFSLDFSSACFLLVEDRRWRICDEWKGYIQRIQRCHRKTWWWMDFIR